MPSSNPARASHAVAPHTARTATFARGWPVGRTTWTIIRAGRSKAVVQITGLRATTLAYPVLGGAWKRSGGVTSHFQEPLARPGHLASPNTSVRPAYEV